ncbi:hypothetical protein [Solimonas marina]|uniref:Uncharacterized protein n=1 Tax=Solimonas marina TaxID=2714601 RepID=A0A969WCF7_9GAMM|nr:hypothetical protein [Solimonas marina]NKF23463.1 hypothetical protein [Solimonas marina]
MFYAIDAYPAYQEVAYQVATAAAEHAANGFAASGSSRGYSGFQAAGARTHCVVHAEGARGIAVCDDATIISFGDHSGATAKPAVMDNTSTPQLVRSGLPLRAVTADDGAINATQAMSAPTRRWFADLLMTFGVGFLLVSAFLFVTSRDPLPVRR